MNKISKSIGTLFVSICLLGCSSPSDIIIDDFESGTFDKWTVEGEAFGTSPSPGSYPGQHEIANFEGTYLVNSFNGGDDSRGTLTSSEFTIERDYINFLLAGGMHPDTYMELVIDGNSIFILVGRLSKVKRFTK
jgi:hypothetical protein